MSDIIEKSLKDIRKTVQKELIRDNVAKVCYAKSKKNKEAVKQYETTATTDLKKATNNYLGSLNTNSKGIWVQESKKVFDKISVQAKDIL